MVAENKGVGGFLRWVKTVKNTAVTPLNVVTGPTLNPRLERLRAPWDAVNDAALEVYKVDMFENVTEFTGIVLHVSSYNYLQNPAEDPSISNTPMEAARAALKKYTLKCYVIDGPQTAIMPVPPSFAKIQPDTDLERLFAPFPEFTYELNRNSTVDIIPVVGDLVKLKFDNGGYTRGSCVKHLRKNHFEVLYSIDDENSKVDQFGAASTDLSVGDFSSEPLERSSPPKWNKPCLNDQDPKFSAGSLRTSVAMKKLIKSWEQRASIPYDYNKPSGWRRGLSSYGDVTKVPAIGWGHLIKKAEQSKYPIKEPIDRIEAQRLFDGDIRKKEKRLATLIKVPITQNQFDAIMSFYFDMGASLLRGKAPILEELNVGNCAAAAKAFLSFGPHSGGQRKEIFIKRRKYEASLFVSSYRGPSIIPPDNELEATAKATKRAEIFGEAATKQNRMSLWVTKSGGLK